MDLFVPIPCNIIFSSSNKCRVMFSLESSSPGENSICMRCFPALCEATGDDDGFRYNFCAFADPEDVQARLRWFRPNATVFNKSDTENYQEIGYDCSESDKGVLGEREPGHQAYSVDESLVTEMDRMEQEKLEADSFYVLVRIILNICGNGTRRLL